ncbi:MAG: hypothetical protein LBV75_01685 [Paludibacter sp.]|nr:hypothetical protein [Paludibacter sp.]
MNIILVAVSSFIVNIPLGMWRSKYKKLSFMWFFLIHASIPLIVTMRILLHTPTAFIPVFIAVAILGQVCGRKCKTLNDKKCRT